MSYLIKELPMDEKPREKYKQNGFSKLSDADLLAIILRTGTKELSAKDLAINILLEIGGLKNLKETSLETLSKMKGIGEVKAITLLTAVEIAWRLQEKTIQKNHKILKAQDVYELLKLEMENLKQEHFCALFLNSKNEIITRKTIFIGSANESIVHPRDIFKEAIKNSAVKLMVVHNHPSGDPTPSKEDILFTQNLIEAGKLLQLPILDHIIIGKSKYYSFYDQVMK